MITSAPYQFSELAQFHVHRLQFMNEQSELTQALPAFATDETLLELYRLMCFTRSGDEKAVNLQRTGQCGTYPASTGQEAISTGIGHAMADSDVFCPYYRDQGTLLQRGVRWEDIYTYWGGDEAGNLIPEAVNTHDFPVSVPIASQFQYAAGIAFAMAYRGESNAVVATGGEGSTSEGDFHEALNLAGTHQLPLVVVINNNQWAISVPRDSQTSSQTIAQKGIAAGVDCLQVDGNDVIAVREAVALALEKARSKGGPTLIEALSYRLCDHTTADDFSRYADEAHLKAAKEHEPIARMRRYLTEHHQWNDDKENALLSDLNSHVQEAAQTYLNRSKPKIDDMFNHMYAHLPKELEEQRELAKEGY